MKPGTNYVTLLNGKRAVRSRTWRLKGGGFLHIDRFVVPICKPKRKK